MVTLRTALTVSLLWPSSAGVGLPVSGLKCGRTYDGIGGLSNSCAPWLRGYNESVFSDIMDVLFKPRWAGAAQVLKLEIGGDGHSTINTESSFMHVPDPANASFNRGWESMLALEAKKRNPNIKIGGLAWSWPFWTKDDMSKKVGYLTAWVTGMKKELNITVDYIGLQNEGKMTGGYDQASVALRKALDSAGHNHTRIECCDNHNFDGLPTDPTTDYYKAVDTYGVHEPLRNSESVPAEYSATGKPIWSSESYTTFSDSNGGGCWYEYFTHPNKRNMSSAAR
jgi:galactosylceramidase